MDVVFMKMIFLVWIIVLLSGCSNQGSSNSDIHECRKLAYEKNNANSGASIDHIYNQCVLIKTKAREKQQKEENIDSFMDFIFEIFWPSKD